MRLARPLAFAAVPVALVAACSSGSPGSSGANGSSASPSSASPAPVRYASLPDPCAALSRATVKSLVPGSKKPGGTAAGSGEPKGNGGCSWSGLHGYQYRYLDNSIQRFDNIAGQPADGEAGSAYRTAVRAAASAHGTRSTPLAGVGDEATVVTWNTTKDHAVYRNATLVTRSANVVLTVDYTGAGLQGNATPTAAGVGNGTRLAAREALATLR